MNRKLATVDAIATVFNFALGLAGLALCFAGYGWIGVPMIVVAVV